jgi:DtxR family Mn-dependent transcriptional regulator
MSSKTQENYLKALYYLHSKSVDIAVSDVAGVLDVSTPTVNDMVKKLHKAGLLTYEKYKPIKLTDEGLRSAALVVRRHRLAEIFLSQIMGFGWEEVHDIAEEMEHIKSTALFDRMDDLLGYPTADPHGSPIPDKDGNIRVVSFITLSEASIGSTVILRGLKDSNKELLLFLNRKQIQLGTKLVIVDIEEYDRSMYLNYTAGGKQHLSGQVCANLLVEVV